MKLNLKYCLIGIAILIILYYCLGRNVFEGMEMSTDNEANFDVNKLSETNQLSSANGLADYTKHIEGELSDLWDDKSNNPTNIPNNTYSPNNTSTNVRATNVRATNSLDTSDASTGYTTGGHTIPTSEDTIESSNESLLANNMNNPTPTMNNSVQLNGGVLLQQSSEPQPTNTSTNTLNGTNNTNSTNNWFQNSLTSLFPSLSSSTQNNMPVQPTNNVQYSQTTSSGTPKAATQNTNVSTPSDASSNSLTSSSNTSDNYADAQHTCDTGMIWNQLANGCIPNVSSPNVSSPNVSSPNVSSPNASSPNASSPNASSPNVSSPNVSSPSVSSLTSSSPNILPGAELPSGQSDKYILKSQIVPPVCPACPQPITCSGTSEKKCQPCPACERCPEPSFECKKVPNYNSGNNSFLPSINSNGTMGEYGLIGQQNPANTPRPLLTDFSTFSK